MMSKEKQEYIPPELEELKLETVIADKDEHLGDASGDDDDLDGIF